MTGNLSKMILAFGAFFCTEFRKGFHMSMAASLMRSVKGVRSHKSKT